jgi:sensor histidine kinase YesM
MYPTIPATSFSSLSLRKIKSKRKFVYGFFLVLTLVRGIMIRIFYPEYTILQQCLIALIALLFMVFMWEVIDGINNWLNLKMPFEQGVKKRLISQLLLCIAITFSLHTVLLIAFRDWLPQDFNRLVLGISYFIDFVLVFAINTAFFGIYFFNKWKLNLLRTERLERDRTNAHYENLKNQLNPHFLFNSLSSLDSLIFENQELASQFLQQLSRVFRYVLDNKDKELVELGTEVKFISRYIFLLRTRFGGALQVYIDLEEQTMSRRIVPVTLQILIENAIKHNIINEENQLTIRVFADDQYLHVRNTLHKKSIVETSNKLGLKNLKSLYCYLSPLPVLVEEEENTFAVSIPLL